MDLLLLEQPNVTLELVALTDIESWSASGAKSASASSIAPSGLRSVVTLEKLPSGYVHAFGSSAVTAASAELQQWGLSTCAPECCP